MGRPLWNQWTSSSSNLSPYQRCWKSARYFCCRFGSYPLFVAPIATVAWLLSLYSTLGCQSIELEVGFTPSNLAWNESHAGLGLWHYQSDTPATDGSFISGLYDNCQWYSEDFSSQFIEKDRTWKVARIMAMISGIGSFCACITAWFFVCTPLPVGFFWPALLLPLVMVSFIAEGSKFLLFDIGICHNSIWYPSGIDSKPQAAEHCGMGYTSFFTVSAASVLLISLLSVCLHSPTKRPLDPDYGLYYVDDVKHDIEACESEFDHPEQPQIDSYPAESLYTDHDIYTTTDDGDEGVESRYHDDDFRDAESPSSFSSSSRDRRETQAPRSFKSLVDRRDDTSSPVTKADPGDQALHFGMQKVSESRLSKMATMKLNLSADADDELIEQFVDEMNHSFASY
jgi:hypothetical protein